MRAWPSADSWETLGIGPGDRYAVVSEAATVRFLVRYCWLYEALAGEEAAVTRTAEKTLERWVAQGLPCRKGEGGRLFDPWQVFNFMVRAGLRDGEPTYLEHYVPTFRRACAAWLPEHLVPGGAGSRDVERFECVLRREFYLQGEAPGRCWRLRLPLPLEHPAQREVTIALVEPVPPEGRLNMEPGRLEVQLPASFSGRLALGVRIRFTSDWQALDLDAGAEEIELYTRPHEGLLRITPPIAKLADELAGGVRDARQVVYAIWRFFFEHMKNGYIHLGELDQNDPLTALVQRGWFDCFAGAVLFAALCRARGIPARIVNGLLLYPGRVGNHYWLDVLVPGQGWLPIDLASWPLAAGRLEQPPWSNLFLCQLDHRLRFECFPRQRVGTPWITLPHEGYTIEALAGPANEMSYYDLERGQLLHKDWREAHLCSPGSSGRDALDARGRRA